MVQSESCLLCLTSKSKWFLDIFCEESQTQDMAKIIAKHLWFDLKPSEQAYVCAECWKNVHDFHIFYCKLEMIHKDLNDACPSSNAEGINTQPDFEFHPIETVKIEPLDEDYELDDKVEMRLPKQSVKVTPSPSQERPKRSSSATVTYKAEISSDSESDRFKDGDDRDFLAEDFDDDDDEDYAGAQHNDDDEDDDDDDDDLDNDDDVDDIAYFPKKEDGKPVDKQISKDNDESASAVPRKRRGRSAKAASEVNSSSADNSIKKETRIKRTRKQSKKEESSSCSSESDSESFDNASDYDGTDVAGSDVRRSRKHKRRSLGGKRPRDDRLFHYVEEFICYLCPDKIEFERFHHANLHYKQVHDEPAYLKCPKCDKKCFTPGGFLSHMETHDNPDKNKCPICGKVTDQKITLKKHMRAHRSQMEETLPYPCRLCPRRFEQEKTREKHERLHGRKIVIKKEKGRDVELIAFYKKIYCEICEGIKVNSTSFDNFWDLKVHMATEHNKTPYLKCPICFKKNVCRQQLMVHVDVHHNPDKYRCSICGEIHQNLEKHKQKAHQPETVPEEKNYSCEHCGKMFKCESNLKNHIDRVHGVKDVLCDVCNKPFNRKALGAHKRSAHSDEMFMCEHCPKMFKTRSGLESHKGEHDVNLRKPVKCNLCGKEMRRGASMAKHMKTIHSQEDPVNCNLCGKLFRTSFHMMRHRANTCSATIDSRPFKCEVCGKGFAMKLTMTEHMTTHTRTSLYQCAFCYKTFGYISNLYKHRKKAHPEEWQEVQARPEQGIATVIEIRN